MRRPVHGGRSLALDVILAGAAVAGLIRLRAGHAAGSGTDSAALLAPGLLVFAVAVLGVRLLPLLCRWLARATRGTRHLGAFLASRQIARRPAGLRLAAMLAVAAGLATFAVAGESVAATNRSARAAGELGMPAVALNDEQPVPSSRKRWPVCVHRFRGAGCASTPLLSNACSTAYIDASSCSAGGSSV